MISVYIESADAFSLCEGVTAWFSRSRIHYSVAGTIPDHCRVFALSDAKKERYRHLCDHQQFFISVVLRDTEIERKPFT